jgi:hypothetical protein
MNKKIHRLKNCEDQTLQPKLPLRKSEFDLAKIFKIQLFCAENSPIKIQN